MKRKASIGGFLVVLGGVLIGLPVLLTWRVYHQERLDYALIAAIKRHDLSLALALLKQGADGNARDMGDKPSSFQQAFADFCDKILHRSASTDQADSPTALLLFLQQYLPQGVDPPLLSPQQ